MSGTRRQGVWFAALALLLALIVPARAVALCCLDGLADREAPVGAHDPASHHGPDHAGREKSAVAPAAPSSDCDAPAAPAPLLRERSCSDDAAGAGDAALPSPTMIVALVPSTEPAILLVTPVSFPDRGRIPHPLLL